MQAISFSEFDKFVYITLVILGPLSLLFLVILGFVQMGKHSSWMTRFCYGICVFMLLICFIISLNLFKDSAFNKLFGLMLIGFVFYSAFAYGFKMKLNKDKSVNYSNNQLK